MTESLITWAFSARVEISARYTELKSLYTELKSHLGEAGNSYLKRYRNYT